MDSVTQAVLGGCVGYAVLGKQLGRKAAVYGALYGTLPDLDVVIDYGGAIEDFTYHRGFSHSFFVHAAAAPVFAWIMTRIEHSTRDLVLRWMFFMFAVFSSHAFIDALTVYGTQLMWPITEHPYSISTLFIIDPLYSLPLIAAFIAVLVQKQTQARTRWNYVALAVSTSYILWSFVAKELVDTKIERALVSNNFQATHVESTPAPFTTLLWRFVAVQDDQYIEGYVSLFDEADDVSLYRYSRDTSLLKDIKDSWRVQRLQWFSKDLYTVEQVEQNIVIRDLRMGIEGSYVFSFVIGEVVDGNVQELPEVKQIAARPDLSVLGLVFKRITDPSVDLSVEARTN